MRNVSYDRPVKATLHVHLASGETFEATAEDLKRFGYVDPSDVSRRLRKWVTAALERNGIEKAHDVRETGLLPFDYAVECALYDYGHMPDERSGDQLAVLARVKFEEASDA